MKKREPEKDDGNIEYKSILVDKTESRVEMIATQMAYRVNEGKGEAIYVLGVSNSGNLLGLNDDEFTESFNNLSLAAKTNNYSMTIISTKTLDNKKKINEILVRERNEHKYIDVKVAIAGHVDAGKTTLLSTLITGKHDDGRGTGRLTVFNYRHEVISGRTSSVSQRILGFDDKGQITNYSEFKKSWPDIVRDSSKIISFFDLCGHEKYLKTTILGLTSSFPDICFILVAANMGITKITQEHIFLCVTLKIPFIIVITKIDMCERRKKILKETVRSVNKLLKLPGLRRIPYKITNKEDVIMCSKNVYSESVVPIFHVSNVTGVGIDYVKQFLNLLRPRDNNLENKDKVLYYIDTTFYVPGVGTVVGGQLISGEVKTGDKLLLGPTDGKYRTVQVRSIHCKRVPMDKIRYGSYVCLGLRKVDRKSIRRGNVLISMNSPQIAEREFVADITVLKTHSTTVKPGYEPVIHLCTIRQSAKLISISNKLKYRKGGMLNNDSVLRVGDKATVRFRFVYQSEYVLPGSRMLMAEGRVKIIGIVR